MERSRLHNLSLPPGLTWGRQRFLRGMNVNPIRGMAAVEDNDESSDSDEYNDNRSIENHHEEVEELEIPPGGRSSEDPRKRKVRFNLKPLFLAPSPSPSPEIDSIKKSTSEEEGEISVTREKLVIDFQTEVGKLKEAILENDTPDDEIAPRNNSPLLNSESLQNSENQYNITPPPPPPPPDAGEINTVVDDPMSERKSKRPRRNLERKEERAKFSISLSRREIEDDFISMTGKKPPRKPNKRPKNIQMKLQGLYPGSRLCEVHPDLYK